MGIVVLAGGGEFEKGMAEVDRAVIQTIQKKDPLTVIITTAAAPDNNHINAGNRGKAWFTSLGLERVEILPIVDQKTANSSKWSRTIEESDIIYLLGGFPHYLAQTLQESRCLTAIQRAYVRGAAICGSSAGAMVLSSFYFNPQDNKLYRGLSFIEDTVIVPHCENFGVSWLQKIKNCHFAGTVLGIDEQTAIIQRDEFDGVVRGKGNITVWSGKTKHLYQPGETVQVEVVFQHLLSKFGV